MKNILVCIDGTGNKLNDGTPTNIERMSRMVVNAEVLYHTGIGSGNLFDRVFGGAFGAGSDSRVSAIGRDFIKIWAPGDKVFVVCFSRGAAEGRQFCQLIHSMNKTRTDENGKISVEVLGCFDTVASFGLPFNKIELFKDFHVSPAVKFAYHAVSLDENRICFQPTLMNQRAGIEEYWFKGNHSHIGGSDFTLDWMTRMVGRHGLEFDNPELLGVKYEKPGFGFGGRTPGILINDVFYPGHHKTRVGLLP